MKWVLKLLLVLCLMGLSGFSIKANTQAGYISYVFQAQVPHASLYEMDGDTLLLNKGGSEVQVYVRNGVTWNKQATLSSDSSDDGFGASMAIKANKAVVGAPEPCGVYSFERVGATWSAPTYISHLCGGFGKFLAMDDNAMIVTSPGSYDTYRGVANFYNYEAETGWVYAQSFLVDETDSFDPENPVALSGDYALVYGSIPFDQKVTKVFKRTSGVWAQHSIIPTASNSLDLDGNTALIGNRVYVRDGNSWTLQATLIPDGNSNFIPAHVAIAGDTILLSDYYYAYERDPSISAYVFTRDGTTWTQQQKLTKPDGSWVTGAVALTGSTLVVDGYIFSNAPLTQTTELLVNGGFETDSNGDFVPDGWTRKNSTGDGRRCNQAGQPAYEGSCSYLFKDDASGNNKLVQNVDLNVHDLNAGDKVKLTGFYNKQSAGSIQVRLFVTYASLPEDQQRITVTAATTGYKALPALAITLKAKPTRVRVQIQNETTSGKTWFDGLSLKLTDNSPAASLIPLP